MTIEGVPNKQTLKKDREPKTFWTNSIIKDVFIQPFSHDATNHFPGNSSFKWLTSRFTPLKTTNGFIF